MNRLNKIILSFVLPFFCLLISVSNAEIIANELYTTNSSAYSSSSSSNSLTLEGYSPRNIAGAVKDYILNSNDTVLKPILEDLKSKGFSKSVIYITMNGSVPTYRINIYPDEFEFDFTHTDSNPPGVRDNLGTYAPSGAYYYCFWEDRSTYWGITVTQGSDSYAYKYDAFTTPGPDKSNHFLEFRNMSVKTMTLSSGFYVWDGETYYYKSPSSDEPATPTLPSNSEIAQAVQSFYNSDYYKNNKDFEDFIVMYNYETKYFDFIGHNFGNKLGQQIIDAGISIGYPPVSYNERWWKYTLPDEFLTTLFNKYYWLYSTNDFGENIKYEGKGSINDLLDLHFATSSIIVYSTTDYPVNTVLKNENDETESTVELMPGDQYTYDENLDPTTNEYNPLENFIPTDPSQSILGDVDFNEINKVFEENKDILNIENASWLFSANNKLVSYFLGFLLLLIVFLIISKVLGG